MIRGCCAATQRPVRAPRERFPELLRRAGQSDGATVSDMQKVTSIEQLEQIVQTPTEAVANKVRTALHDYDKQWLAVSPFCLIATSNASGQFDVSPKGDPNGIVHVLDEHTIAIADRPGNRRVDGFRNVLDNPRAGLISLVPTRNDTLRINGSASIVSDADFFDDLIVKGHRPQLALVIDVEEVFYHCAKALIRSNLWQPQSWTSPDLPSTAQISKTLVRKDEQLIELENYYADANYRTQLYATPPSIGQSL